MGKIADDKRTDRRAVIACLMAANNRPEKAGLYADAFLEYQTAQRNIESNGSIVANPRTGAAEPNPYLAVRDKAFSRLEALHKAGVKASDLWLHIPLDADSDSGTKAITIPGGCR